jgi:nucleotide-binding universal stress UspA family protein
MVVTALIFVWKGGVQAEDPNDAAADAQLVVVGARGRDGLDQMTLGSVAQAVLQHAPCPVGVVRQAG